MDEPQSSIELVKKLSDKARSVKIPPLLQEKIFLMLERAASSLKYLGSGDILDQTEKYIEWITSLPWENESSDNLDLVHAKSILDRNHFGVHEIKDRILEYLAVMKLTKTNVSKTGKNEPQIRAPILCFVGLVGTGKTTLAYSIAEAMGRKFVRIPFGGMGSAFDLRGQSRMHKEAEPGQVIKALRRAGTKNPVILFDEIDRVSEETRSDIMGVLVELLDPEQNLAFVDHFLDYPFDLSNVLFITTANNTKNISTAVLDRLEPIQMPSYSDGEKITIGRDYIFPKELLSCGLSPTHLTISDDVWAQIVRPLGFDAGIRTLERTINGICRKIAREIVERKGTSYNLTIENINIKNL